MVVNEVNPLTFFIDLILVLLFEVTPSPKLLVQWTSSSAAVLVLVVFPLQ